MHMARISKFPRSAKVRLNAIPSFITLGDPLDIPSGYDVLFATDGTDLMILSDSVVLTSSDNIHWTSHSLPFGHVRDVVWNGELYCATNGTEVATSEDGETWTSETLPTLNDPFNNDPIWDSIGWDGSSFTALSSSVVATSPDGIIWTEYPIEGEVQVDNSTSLSPAPSTDWTNLTWNGKSYTAISKNTDEPVVITSDDGKHWTRTKLPKLPNGDSYESITSDNSVYPPVDVAVSKDGVISTSSDGVIWEHRTIPLSDVRKITRGLNNFMIIGGDSVALTSSDGITWDRKTLPSKNNNNVGFTKSGIFSVNPNNKKLVYYQNKSELLYPVWVTGNLPACTSGIPYNTTVNAKNATSYNLSGGALPDGLNFDSKTAIISGTNNSTIHGTDVFTITASNALGSVANQFSLLFGPAPTIKSGGVLSSAKVNEPYSQKINVKTDNNIVDRLTPLTITTVGKLPKGLTISPDTGEISGTVNPTVKSGNYTFTVSATTPTGTTSRSVTMYIDDKQIPGAPEWTGDEILTPCTIGNAYSTSITAVYATNYQLIDGELPQGITFNPSARIISGICSAPPTSGDAAAFTVRAKNSAGIADQQFLIEYASAPVVFVTTTLPPVYHGQYYKQNIITEYGEEYTVSGTLPHGLTLNNGGYLSGTVAPDAVTSTFTITGRNVVSTQSKSYTITISNVKNNSPYWTIGNKLPSSLVNAKYKYTLSAEYATSYQLVFGSLPPGLTLVSNGVISGTNIDTFTTGTSRYSLFTIRATNDIGSSDQQFEIEYAIIPVFTVTDLEMASIGVPYTQTINATFTTQYSISSGSLPNGLSFDGKTGIISGTPASNAVTSSFNVIASNIVTSVGKHFKILVI